MQTLALDSQFDDKDLAVYETPTKSNLNAIPCTLYYSDLQSVRKLATKRDVDIIS